MQLLSFVNPLPTNNAHVTNYITTAKVMNDTRTCDLYRHGGDVCAASDQQRVGYDGDLTAVVTTILKAQGGDRQDRFVRVTTGLCHS